MTESTTSDSSKAEPSKSTAPKPSTKTSPKLPVKTEKKAPRQTLAVLALLIALIAIAGCGGLFYWSTEQNKVAQQTLNNALNQQLSKQQASFARTQKAQLSQQLQQQQKHVSQQLSSLAEHINADNEAALAQLQASVRRLEKTQPSDWLIHEAEYLIRVAARSLWLTQNSQAAIGLLVDANKRIKQLNNPKFLTVRKAIHQDIERLRLLPQLQTEDAILTLMALAQQVDQLSLTIDHVAQKQASEHNTTLSENENDWQANLAKSWKTFTDSFISIRRLDGHAEPLLTPQQQQHLFVNLKLKLQQAQWAVINQKSDLFKQQINDINQWLTRYFDQENDINQQFTKRLESLKTYVISVNTSTELSAVNAFSQALNGYEIEMPATSVESKKLPELKPEPSAETTLEKMPKPQTESTPKTEDTNNSKNESNLNQPENNHNTSPETNSSEAVI